MQSRLQMIALSVKCRRCAVPQGASCVSKFGAKRKRLHLCRYNDARRILNDRRKLDRWNQVHNRKAAVESALMDAIAKITTEVESYESDTFSARGSKLTHTEALAVVAELIRNNVQPGMNIDGIEIAEAVETVREKVKPVSA
jgi:hypothetical protein